MSDTSNNAHQNGPMPDPAVSYTEVDSREGTPSYQDISQGVISFHSASVQCSYRIRKSATVQFLQQRGPCRHKKETAEAQCC